MQYSQIQCNASKCCMIHFKNSASQKWMKICRRATGITHEQSLNSRTRILAYSATSKKDANFRSSEHKCTSSFQSCVFTTIYVHRYTYVQTAHMYLDCLEACNRGQRQEQQPASRKHTCLQSEYCCFLSLPSSCRPPR